MQPHHQPHVPGRRGRHAWRHARHGRRAAAAVLRPYRGGAPPRPTLTHKCAAKAQPRRAQPAGRNRALPLPSPAAAHAAALTPPPPPCRLRRRSTKHNHIAGAGRGRWAAAAVCVAGLAHAGAAAAVEGSLSLCRAARRGHLKAVPGRASRCVHALSCDTLVGAWLERTRGTPRPPPRSPCTYARSCGIRGCAACAACGGW